MEDRISSVVSINLSGRVDVVRRVVLFALASLLEGKPLFCDSSFSSREPVSSRLNWAAQPNGHHSPHFLAAAFPAGPLSCLQSILPLSFTLVVLSLGHLDLLLGAKALVYPLLGFSLSLVMERV